MGLDIDNHIPEGASTVEFAGGAHYNGHPPNQTIGHWIVVQGYVNNSDDTKFLDPATSVWSIPQGFYYSTNAFVNTFLQSNGITW